MGSTEGCSRCDSAALSYEATVPAWRCRACGHRHQGWVRCRRGPVSIRAAQGEETPCGHDADLVIEVAGRELAVERAVASLALGARATAVPLSWLCPGSVDQVGVVRWDPAHGALFVSEDPDTPARWATLRVCDPATCSAADLVGGPGLLAWPHQHTRNVVNAWRFPPGWDVRGLPDLSGRTRPRLRPVVTVGEGVFGSRRRFP